MGISLLRAYRIARKFYRRKWMGEAQYHLSAIGERSDVWVISFFPFIPEPVRGRFLTSRLCSIKKLPGIIPVYYDSNPKWVEVNKHTGLCREVTYMGYDWMFGDGKIYEESLTWHSPEMLFLKRKNKGAGYVLDISSTLSTYYNSAL